MRVRFFVVFASALLIGAVWTAVPGAAVQTPTSLPPPAVAHKQLETAALIRRLLSERGLPVPPENRNILSICVVTLCQ